MQTNLPSEGVTVEAGRSRRPWKDSVGLFFPSFSHVVVNGGRAMRTEKGYRTRPPKIAVAAFAFSICFTFVGYADQFGDFTYGEYDTSIEITDYPEDAIGNVVIPSEIVGKPVTRIR
jgi:hypothetical protein